MKLEKGLVEVYTGNGKGKTTAAIGLAIRAAGWGLNVSIIFFMKTGNYGENISLSKISNIKQSFYGKDYFLTKDEEIAKKYNAFLVRDRPPEDYVETIKKGLKEAEEDITSGKYDVVVLDEIFTAIYYSLASVEDVLRLIEIKPENVELVLTGRYAPKEIVEKASLVTEMKDIKHPFYQGIEARKGIEY